MPSRLLVSSAAVAVGVLACDTGPGTCAADELAEDLTMLQLANVKRQASEASKVSATVRTTKATGSKDSMDLLKKVRHVADSLLEGSDTTMTADDVTEAIIEARDLIGALSPVIRQQVETAQQQINDAASAVQVCHGQELAAQRSSLGESLPQRLAAAESCQNALGPLRADETRQCNIAEDCLCDEARVRTTAQEALCTSMTETYEVAFCDHHQMCTSFHECHSQEAKVFERARADVEAEMALIVQEYIAVEQSRCLTDLSAQAVTPPRTPISDAALIACTDVDVSAIRINYPNLPAAPAACPAHQHGEPQCVAGTAPHGSDPVLVMKAVSDLFAYSSPFWENDETLAPESAPEVEEDAKYEEFNDTPFNTITLCFGGPSSQCIRHALPQTYSSARALFSAGQIETDTIDQAAWITAFGSDNECPMVAPGFNVECPETGNGRYATQSRVRFGWCTHWWRCCASELGPISNIDVEDTDDAIGLGVDNVYFTHGGREGHRHSPGEIVRQAGLGGAGAGWTQQFNSGPTGYGLRSVWIYVQQA